MPVTSQEIAKLKKLIATARKRRSRWITRRDKLLLKWALDGIDLTLNDVRKYLYAWEIEHAEEQIHNYTYRLLEVKRDAQ